MTDFYHTGMIHPGIRLIFHIYQYQIFLYYEKKRDQIDT